MKKILTTSTKILKTGLSAKGLIDSALHPMKAVRDAIKKAMIRSIVFVIKQAINLTTKDKFGADSHAVVCQLNALADPNADVSRLTKHVQFHMTLDTLLELADDSSEYKILKYIDLTTIKNKVAIYKNSLRQDAYEYISENNFSNINTLMDSVNEIINMPTEIAGCEFVKCKVTVENHDVDKKDFVLLFDVDFVLKAKN